MKLPVNQLPVLILIDSQYLYYQLRKFGMKEIDMDWARFFFKIAGTTRLIRIIWFRPAELRAMFISEKRALEKLSDHKYRHRREDLLNMFSNKKLPPDILQEVRQTKNEAIKWLKSERQTFSEIEHTYESIAHKYSRMHEELQMNICRVGGLKVDPFAQKRTTEKGIDIAMTAHLMDAAYSHEYSSIILLSENKDLAVPLKKIKSRNIEIQTVRFQAKCLKCNNEQYALKSFVNKVQYFSEKEIKKMLIKENVPNPYEEKVFKENIKKLIARAEIANALKATATYIEKNKVCFKDDILSLQTQWINNERDRIKGILTHAEYNKLRQGIYHKLLSLLKLL